MSNQPDPPRNPFADIAPALGRYTEKVLFGEVWEAVAIARKVFAEDAR